MEKVENWDEHFEELRHLTRLDDYDYYESFSKEDLNQRYLEYKEKVSQLDEEIEEVNKALRPISENRTNLLNEISLIERKLGFKK